MAIADGDSGNRRPRGLPRSMASKIVASTVLISLVASAVVLSVTFFMMHKMINDSVDTSLERGFREIAGSIQVDGQGAVRLDPMLQGELETRYWIFEAGPEQSPPRLIDSSGHPDSPVVVSLSKSTSLKRINQGGSAFIGGPVVGLRDRQEVSLVISEKLQPYQTSRNTLMIGLAIAGLVATIGSALVARWTVRRTLRPVRQMARDANSWSEQNLNTRFEITGNSDEFDDLARTLNRLMDRVGSALHSEQLLTSEVAHELRTPLTVILGAAELALGDANDPELRSHLGRIIEQVHTMNSNITALVQIARDQDHQANTRLDACVTDLAASFSPDPGIRLSVTIDSGGEVLVPHDPMSRALSPLVDNALRFASSEVGIHVRRHGDRLLISVTDDGPGTTGDPFVGTTGLGLPLSRRLAATMDGQVTLTQASEPTELTLDIPVPSSS
jgi:two-component system OmpR family sensor kinase